MASDVISKITNIERELEAVKRKISRDKKRFNEAAGSWSDIDAEEFKERVES